MQNEYADFGQITEGMDVYDVDGDKVGSVGKVYQPTEVTATGTTAGEPAGTPYLKVDTGFLGLGKDLYIPASAISEVTADRVVLTADKDRLDEMGWDERPTWLRDDF
jgi:hypothetical protein